MVRDKKVGMDGNPFRSKGRLSKTLSNPKYYFLYLAGILIAIAAIPRVFFPNWSFFPNGVDEGIDIMSGMMMSAGYTLYSQINTVQPPLMISIYGLLGFGPTPYRLLSTFTSLIIISLVMYLGYRIGGRSVMVASGAFLVMDVLFLHQSRQASLDIFSLVWVVVAITLLVRTRKRWENWTAVIMGITIGISIMTKLFGVIAAGGIFLILMIDILSTTRWSSNMKIDRFLPPRGSEVRPRWEVLSVFVLSGAFVVLLIMVFFGAQDVFQGIILNQLNRPRDGITTKLMFLGIFSLCNIVAIPFLFLGLKPLYRKPEGIIIPLAALYLAFMLLQAKTWIHHLIFLSPALSLAAGVGIIRVFTTTRWWRLRKNFTISNRSIAYVQVFLILAAAIVGGGMAIIVGERGQPASYNLSDRLKEVTNEEDYVISGDPMIPINADRNVPPEVVNVAIVQWPPISNDQLNRTVIGYGVEAVIITYHLLDMEGFIDFVEKNFDLEAHIVESGMPYPMEDTHYYLYTLKEDSPLRDLEDWGSKVPPDLDS